MKNKKIIGSVIAIIVAVGVFYGGYAYGKAHTGQAAAGRFGGAGQFARGGAQNQVFAGRAGGAQGGPGGITAGTILSKDDTSVTVSLQGGGSKIVFTGASTTVSEMTQGSLSDLATGTPVFITGTPNPDGSLTAQMIQVRPAGR